MSLESSVTRIIKNASQYASKHPIFRQSYAWMMGAHLENARNYMNTNENTMRILRDKAYNLQHEIQQKEKECRTIGDSLRESSKTDPNYMNKVGQEIELIKQIENLQNELMEHKSREQNTFEALQQSIRDYHIIDGEYRDRLKRISYSWSIIWMICSVGIGTVFAYRLRHNFLNDIKVLSDHSPSANITNTHDIETMIGSAFETQHELNEDILQHMIRLQQNNKQITKQLDALMQQNNAPSNNDTTIDTNERYLWLTGGIVVNLVILIMTPIQWLLSLSSLATFVQCLRRSNRFLKTKTAPYAFPIDVCYPKQMGNFRTSIKLTCEEDCDGDICERRVVSWHYGPSNEDCEGDPLYTDAFTEADRANYPFNCYEDEELDGATVNQEDYAQSYMIVRLSRAKWITAESANATDEEECVRDGNSAFYKTFPAITNKCVLGWKGEGSSATPYWYHVLCNENATFVERFDGYNCTGNVTDAYIPNGCDRRRWRGKYYYTEVLECSHPDYTIGAGFSNKNNIICSIFFIFMVAFCMF